MKLDGTVMKALANGRKSRSAVCGLPQRASGCERERCCYTCQKVVLKRQPTSMSSRCVRGRRPRSGRGSAAPEAVVAGFLANASMVVIGFGFRLGGSRDSLNVGTEGPIGPLGSDHEEGRDRLRITGASEDRPATYEAQSCEVRIPPSLYHRARLR
jgi:hypothetical protein